MARTTYTASGIKITVPLRPESLPRAGVPMDGPIGDLDWEIVLEGGALRITARLNGKNYRKMLKACDAANGNVSVILQGSLRPTQEGQPLVLDSAGFQVNVKTPKPEGTVVATELAKPGEAALPSPAKEPAPESPAALAPLPGTSLPGRRVYVPSAQGPKSKG